MTLREALVAILIASIGLAAAAWFLATHERVTESEWTGYRGEARRNPWLAAQRFLNRVEIPANELRALQELRTLPSGATLIVPQGHQSIPARLREALIAWVQQGGYLIVEAEPPARPDALLDAFGVQRSAVQREKSNRGTEEAGERQFDQVRLPNAEAAATVDLHDVVSLDADDAWFRAENRSGTWLLTLRSGDGPDGERQLGGL